MRESNAAPLAFHWGVRKVRTIGRSLGRVGVAPRSQGKEGAEYRNCGTNDKAGCPAAAKIAIVGTE